MNQTKKPSIFRRFIQVIVKHKILSLIFFSLLGGVPGIINIWNWTHDKPKFRMHIESLLQGYVSRKEGRVYFFVLTGAIQNNGTKPLFPNEFNLSVKYKDTTVNIRAMPLPDSFFTKPEDGSVKVSLKTPKDLLTCVRVDGSDAIYGILFFPVRELKDNIVSYESVDVSCVDINSKEWKQSIDLDKLGTDEKIHSLKTGLEVAE